MILEVVFLGSCLFLDIVLVVWILVSLRNFLISCVVFKWNTIGLWIQEPNDQANFWGD
jgi:hypothetical protein